MSSHTSVGSSSTSDHPDTDPGCSSFVPRTEEFRPSSRAEGIRGWQLNAHNRQSSIDILSKHLEDNPSVTFVAISEPPWSLRRGHAIPGFKNIRALAPTPEDTLSVLLIRDYLATIQVPICSNRIAITKLELVQGKPMHLVSAYIQPQTGLGWQRLKEWLRAMVPSPMEGPTFPLLIVGDFNSHTPFGTADDADYQYLGGPHRHHG